MVSSNQQIEEYIMTNYEILMKLVDTEWTDRDRAYGLFMSYCRNRPDLTGEEIIRVIETIVPQRFPAIQESV